MKAKRTGWPYGVMGMRFEAHIGPNIWNRLNQWRCGLIKPDGPGTVEQPCILHTPSHIHISLWPNVLPRQRMIKSLTHQLRSFATSVRNEASWSSANAVPYIAENLEPEEVCKARVSDPSQLHKSQTTSLGVVLQRWVRRVGWDWTFD